MPAIKKMLSLDEVEAQTMFELPTRELMHAHSHSGKHVTNSKTITASDCNPSASTSNAQGASANATAALLAAALGITVPVNISPAIAAGVNVGGCNQLVNNG
jgi:hypothetical protein